MNRTASFLSSLGLLCLLAAPALGDATAIGGYRPEFGSKYNGKTESPQWFMLEIKFTPYTPHIDQSAGLRAGATPFADLFNAREYNETGQLINTGQQPGYRLLTSIEFDVQFLRRPWGNFGVGLTTGFYRRTTHAFVINPDGSGCTLATCSRSGDESGLNILPLSALFIYRLDLLANRYHIPIVPYFKVGLAYYVWWMNDGNGILSASKKPSYQPGSTIQPQEAKGGSFGFVLHPGIAIQLDFLERKVAHTMDMELGINHSYLFVELNYANVNGFGAANKLNLSDTMVNTGLAFEF